MAEKAEATVVFGVLNETSEHESRVALTPDIVTRLRKSGVTCLIESGAGVASHYVDEDYTKAGAQVVSADDVIARADALGFVDRPSNELLARVKVRLRQSTAAPADSQQIVAGGVVLDLVAHTATVDGRPVELSAREFALARELMEHAGQVLSREQLLDRVWGYEVTGSSNVVDVYVRYLRAKLGSNRIVTVRGVGYRFVD